MGPWKAVRGYSVNLALPWWLGDNVGQSLLTKDKSWWQGLEAWTQTKRSKVWHVKIMLGDASVLRGTPLKSHVPKYMGVTIMCSPVRLWFWAPVPFLIRCHKVMGACQNNSQHPLSFAFIKNYCHTLTELFAIGWARFTSKSTLWLSSKYVKVYLQVCDMFYKY